MSWDSFVYLFERLAWLEVVFGLLCLVAGFGVGYHYWYRLRRQRLAEYGEQLSVLERQCGRLERRRESLDHQLRDARAGNVNCLRGTLGSGEEHFAEFSRRIGGLHHELRLGHDALIRARRQSASSADQVGGGRLQLDGATDAVAGAIRSGDGYDSVIEGLGEAILPLRSSSHELAEFSDRLRRRMEKLSGKGDRLKTLRDRCGELVSEAERCHSEVISVDRYVGTGFGSGGNAIDPSKLLERLAQIEEGVLSVHRNAGILMDETDQLSCELSPFLIMEAEQKEQSQSGTTNPLEDCSERLIDTAGQVFGWVQSGSSNGTRESNDWSGQIAGAAERIHAAGAGLSVAEAELADIRGKLGSTVRDLHAFQGEFAREMGEWLDALYGRFEGSRKTTDREWRMRALASSDEEGASDSGRRHEQFRVIRTLGAGGGVRLAELNGKLAAVERVLEAGHAVKEGHAEEREYQRERLKLQASLSTAEAELKLREAAIRDLQLQVSSLEAKLPDEDLEIDAIRAEIDALKGESGDVVGDAVEEAEVMIEEPISETDFSNGSGTAPSSDDPEIEFASFGFGGVEDSDEDEDFIMGGMRDTQRFDIKADLNGGQDLPEDAFRDPRLGVLYRKAPSEVDPLSEISGIGEKLEKRLNEFGVYRFAQIAGWDDATIEEFSERLSFKGRVERDDWVSQAKKLMAGEG